MLGEVQRHPVGEPVARGRDAGHQRLRDLVGQPVRRCRRRHEQPAGRRGELLEAHQLPEAKLGHLHLEGQLLPGWSDPAPAGAGGCRRCDLEHRGRRTGSGTRPDTQAANRQRPQDPVYLGHLHPGRSGHGWGGRSGRRYRGLVRPVVEKHGQGGVPAPRAGEGVLEPIAKEGAVGQPGERVVQRLVAGLRLCAA